MMDKKPIKAKVIGERTMEFSTDLFIGEDKSKEWATISSKGELLKFDIEECKKIASLYDEGNREQGACMAKLALLLIQEQKEKDAQICFAKANEYEIPCEDISDRHGGKMVAANTCGRAILSQDD